MPRNILTPRNLHTLASFAASNVLLAFDYDGTLAPIAATPSAARMRAETRRRLARISERYPCVVISGRTLEDLEKRLLQQIVHVAVGAQHAEQRRVNAIAVAAKQLAGRRGLAGQAPVDQQDVLDVQRHCHVPRWCTTPGRGLHIVITRQDHGTNAPRSTVVPFPGASYPSVPPRA